MPRDNINLELSIIITAHNEGLVAHKTMLSVQQAIDQLPEATSYEVIISIDSGDTTTKEYFKRYIKLSNYTVIDVNFGDLSKSRNNAAVQSRGRCITFLDADDLVSENWYATALNVIKDTPSSIVHPEYSITFGDDNLIWKKRSSGDYTLDVLCLIDNNLWDSPCLAERQTFLDNPYQPNGGGYGYEDKLFNSQTLSRSIRHLVAPQTILFVRRKITGSMLRTASSDLVTVAKNDLMKYGAIQNIPLYQYLPDNYPMTLHRGKNSVLKAVNTSKQLAFGVHNHAKNYDAYRKIMKPLRDRRQNRLMISLSGKYPNWMLESWKKIHKIDNQIFPSRELLKGLRWYNAENITPGIKYVQLIQSFTEEPNTLLFVPHLIKGGADMLFINYTTELMKQHPDWHIAALQTENRTSVWKDKLPKEVGFVSLYNIFHGLNEDTQHRLLATLITQNDIKRIIIGNSQLAYDFVSRYQTLIKTLDIAIYCFAFGEEFDDEGRLWGHIHTGIPKIYPVVYRIITDNQNTVNKLEREYAFDPDRFRVHYQPTSNEIKSTTSNDNTPMRILWASRVCKQKRPDILKAVSNKLDKTKFIIDAYGQLEEGLTASYFDDSRVHYKGAFNGSSNLPTEHYDAFMYTSEGDGVPNILQEMTAAGLPIVASNVGGIGEFIKTDNTGFLIEDHENIDSYVSAIQRLADSSLRLRLNQNAQKLLGTSFSHHTWKADIRRDFDK